MMQATQPLILRVQAGNEDTVVRQAVNALKKGSLVILPTETVYGIACDPRVPGAEERLFQAKGRDRSKPVALLAASIEDAEKYGAEFNEAERKLADMFWPGPLTLILNVRPKRGSAAAADAPHRIAGGKCKLRKEGFRIPDCGITRAILKSAGGVLRVSSANLSGEPPALTAEEALRSLGAYVEVVIDAGTLMGTPSTVVKVGPTAADRNRKEIIILREGAITKSRLSDAIRQ